MVMRHFVMVGALVLAVSATTDACPIRYERLTAAEREEMREHIARIEAVLEAQDREREQPSHGLELAAAVLCVGSLIALRRVRKEPGELV
jgi:hypothetical protein